MTLPPHTQNFLNSINLLPKKPLADYHIEEWRTGYHATVAAFGAPIIPINRIEDFSIQSNHADFEIPLRLYTPNAESNALWIYVHGGGWCRGDIESYDTHLREMANTLGISILSVEYRLAPEHPFPAGHQDVYDVYLWVRQTFLKERGYQQLYLGGDSGGGNLTAGVICRLIHEGIPLPDQYIGIYPSLDFSLKQESYKTYETGYLLTTEAVDFYINQYLGMKEHRFNFAASPLQFHQLDAFPKTLLITAECDPLRDEQIEFYCILKQAGIDVRQNIVPGVIHPFMLLGRVFPEVKDCINWIKENL